MDLELEDKVIIVTGASRGLGSAISKYLIDEGAYVVAAARSEEDLNSLQNTMMNEYFQSDVIFLSRKKYKN